MSRLSLNERVVSDVYPLPLLWDNLQSAAHHNIYIAIDLNNGFWNVPLADESKPLTGLVTHRGQFEFNVLPFGIKNSPPEFQGAVDIAFGVLYGKEVLTYIEDTDIYANTIDSLFQLLTKLLSKCVEH